MKRYEFSGGIVRRNCFTQGESEEDALSNAKEAIICYLEGLEKPNQIKSRPGILLKELEVCI
ncbi:MAG TPA: type II toxin-antitoxin system HicB family antitoxin [Candidatus Kapabacteria bacterium]|nr:type II toxin-antitoxin system HicB family antitoxin [Candidatus Kapabacteria bacterium]